MRETTTKMLSGRALNSHLEKPGILVAEQHQTLCPGVIRETSEGSSVPEPLLPVRQRVGPWRAVSLSA